MALPTVEKTWQFNVNQTPANNQAAVLHAIKASITGFASNPWQVVSSSNTTLAGDTDYWTGPGDVRWNISGKYSWIVLRQPAIAPNFQIFIATKTTGGGWNEDMHFRISPSAGFTGGTVSAFPTATDQILETFYSFNNYNYDVVDEYGSTGWPTIRHHAMMSTDGKCTRWVVTGGGVARHVMVIDVPKNPVAAWTDPWIVVSALNCYLSDPEMSNYYRLNQQSLASYYNNVVMKIGGVATRAYLTAEGMGGSYYSPSYPDDDTGEWLILPPGIAGYTVGGQGGYKGGFYDLWWGNPFSPSGTTYPEDDSRQLVSFRDFVMPWNGTVPLV